MIHYTISSGENIKAQRVLISLIIFFSWNLLIPPLVAELIFFFFY